MEALRIALKEQRNGEMLEKAVGRAIRRLHLAYADYLNIMGLIREKARRQGVAVEEAAEQLLQKYEQNVED